MYQIQTPGSGRSRILKGGVPLSKNVLTALVRTHEAGNACARNDKKVGSADPKEPPWIRHCQAAHQFSIGNDSYAIIPACIIILIPVNP